jgi:hypothetical protein
VKDEPSTNDAAAAVKNYRPAQGIRLCSAKQNTSAKSRGAESDFSNETGPAA